MESSDKVEQREVLTGGRVKGAIVRTHILWVRRYRGESGEERLQQALPADLRKELESIIPSDWYPFETLIRLDRLIIELFGNGTPDLSRELGRYSAHLNLSVPFRSYRREEIGAFFRESAALHSEFQDFGTVECLEQGERKVSMVHRGYACFSPLFCASGLGYYEQAIVEHRSRPVRLEETSCQCRGDSTCTFEIEWE